VCEMYNWLTHSSITIHSHNLEKQILTRTLNACYVTWNPHIVEFLFRLLRHYILDREYFSMFHLTESMEVVWPEFVGQFQKEFGFDESMQLIAHQYFNSVFEWGYISTLIAEVETQHPVLLQCKSSSSELVVSDTDY
jgi:hypothetical protein